MTKRVICVLLILAMLFTGLPAFATENESTEINSDDFTLEQIQDLDETEEAESDEYTDADDTTEEDENSTEANDDDGSINLDGGSGTINLDGGDSNDDTIQEITENYMVFSELSDEEKELFCEHYAVTETEMEAAEGLEYQLLESLDLIYFAQTYNLTIEQANEFAEACGGYDNATIEISKLNGYKTKFGFSDNVVAEFKAAICRGFATDDILYAYIVSQVVQQPIGDIICTEYEALDIDNATYQDLSLLKEMYKVKISVLYDYMTDNDLTVDQLLEAIQTYQMEHEIYIDAPSMTMFAAGFNDPAESVFPHTYRTYNNESISQNSGELTFEDTAFTLPGKNGLDLTIKFTFNSENSLYHSAGSTISAHYYGVGWDLNIPSIRQVIKSPYYAGMEYTTFAGERLSADYSTGIDSVRGYFLAHSAIYGTSQYQEKMYDARPTGKNDEVWEVTINNKGVMTGIDFDGYARVVMDRFGNNITYNYETLSSSDRTKYGVVKVIKTITDSHGRRITFNRVATQLGYNLVIDLPDGNTVTYIFESIDTKGNHKLVQKIDQVGRSTNYKYDIVENLKFSGALTKRVNLTEVWHVTGGKTFYYYEKSAKYVMDFGSSGRYICEYSRVSRREDVYLREDPYNVEVYSLLGDINFSGYTRWGTYEKPVDGWTYQTKIVAGSKETLNTFNKYSNLINKKVYLKDASGNITNLQEVDYEYDGNNAMYPTLVKTKTYDGDKYIENISTMAYSNGRKTRETVDDAATRYFYKSRFYERAHSYTYEALQSNGTMKTITDSFYVDFPSNFFYELSLAVAPNGAGTFYTRTDTETITETYDKCYLGSTPTPDYDAVLLSKSHVFYDEYGNIVESRTYANETDYSTMLYGYDELNPASRPCNANFNNLFITTQTAIGLKDADGNSLPNIVFTYKYDVLGNVVEANIPNKYVYEYDGVGRVTKKIHPDQTFVTWAYLSTRITQTLENGLVIEKNYDMFGNIRNERIDGKLIKEYEYDIMLRLKNEYTYAGDMMTSGKFGLTTIYYDAMDRVKVVINTDYEGDLLSDTSIDYSIQTVSGSNTIGEFMVTTTTLEGNSTVPDIVTKEYTNNRGQLIKRGRVDGNNEYIDTFVYDIMGNKTQEKTAVAYEEYNNLAYTTKWDYDPLGRVLKITNANGHYATSTYDFLGNVLTTADFKENQSSGTGMLIVSEYDALGRKIKDTSSVAKIGNTVYNQVTKNYYDSADNITKTTVTSNAPGEAEKLSVVEYEYTSKNQLEKTIVGGEYTTYEYDAVGNQTALVTGNGTARTEYQYDKFSNLKKVIDPLGSFEEYQYDRTNRLEKKTDKNGDVVNYRFDYLGREATAVGKGVSRTTYYTPTGQVQSVSNGNSTTTYAYDNLGRVVTETETGGIVKTYTYNAADLRKSYTLTVGGVQQMSNSYGYDKLNRLINVYSHDGTVIRATYTYDANGNRASLIREFSTTSTTYQYNRANMVTGLQNKKHDGSIISSYSYNYYLDGNQQSKTDNSGKTTTYLYDAAGRLKAETESGTGANQSYSYLYEDLRSNRTKMTVTGDNARVVDYTYNLANQLMTEKTGNETIIYSYDNNGNQILKAKQITSPGGTSGIGVEYGGDLLEEYEYDGFNQLTSVKIEGVDTAYKYKADGLRLSKTTGGVTTQHIWDGQNISADMTNGTVTAKYLRGVDLISSSVSGQTTRYYMYNAHGDVVQLVGSSYTVVRRYEYDAFGVEQEIAGQDAETDNNPFRYCGEYFDKETGSIYLRARYYNPKIGRFITQDPICDGLNWYTYCGNSPVMFRDPSGLTTVGLRAYAEIMLEGSTITWNEKTRIATITYNGKTLTIEATASNLQDGHIYIDDSVFIDTFGSGTYGNLETLSRCQAEMISDVYRGGGELAIVSAATANGGGHSWIEYTSSKGETFSVSTMSVNHVSGIYYNVELGTNINEYADWAKSKVKINGAQVKNVVHSINKVQYGVNGQDAWTPTKNCSWFAVYLWSAAGQPILEWSGYDQKDGWYGNPHLLLESIRNKYQGSIGYTEKST